MKNLQKYIIVNGYPLAGKDSFVEYCTSYLWDLGIYSHSVSSVDPIKEAAVILGWDYIKNDKGRKFLSDLKDLSTEAYDLPMKYMSSTITEAQKDHPDHVLFFHIRESKEIKKFVEAFPTTVTVCIHRVESEKHHTNTGDSNILHYHYDIHIDNNGNLDDLSILASKFMETLTCR